MSVALLSQVGVLQGTVPGELISVSLDELRLHCRQKIESCELWLRRLVHERIGDDLGPAYFEEGVHAQNHIFNADVRRRVALLMANQPSRYRRHVDALLIDDLTTVLCKEGVYQRYFRKPLHAFVSKEHVRWMLDRLIPIRNALSHSNAITMHDVEKAFCYCDEIIGSLKEFYAAQGMENEFNAPLFVRFTDSEGNSEILRDSQGSLSYLTGRPLYCGDSLRWEVEVDANFDPDEYTVSWVVANIPQGETGSGKSFQLSLQQHHVNENFNVQVLLKSKKNWHRHGNFDARLVVSYKVFPPVGG